MEEARSNVHFDYYYGSNLSIQAAKALLSFNSAAIDQRVAKLIHQRRKKDPSCDRQVSIDDISYLIVNWFVF